MGDGPPVAELVDQFLAQKKTLGGSPTWAEGNRAAERRAAAPIFVGGESTQCEVCLTAYPDLPDLRFTIVLKYDNHCIWRLDYDPPSKRHTNPLDRIRALQGEAQIVGPNYHSWSDNRYLATPATLPKELSCARSLPANIKGWDNAFRWFCGETNVTFREPIVELPPRGRLL